jgi:uncharacterized protein (DUF362 family)
MAKDGSDTRRLTRRHFVAIGGGVVGCGLAGAYFGGGNRLLATWRPGSYAAFVGPEPLPPTRVYPAMPPATVSVAGVQASIEAAVREAVTAAGGIEEIEAGQRVFIKPNMCGPGPGKIDIGRVTTKPEVLRAVIRLVKERGAHAIVGDRSMYKTEEAFVTTGFARVCEEEGAEPFPFTRGEYIRVDPGKRHWSKGFRIPKILTEVDHLISVPMLKNHDVTAAEFTCCLKQFVGVALPLDRFQPGDNALHVNNISEKVAELNLAAKPLINIVDATTVVLKGGPDLGMMSDWPFNPDRANVAFAQPGLILASKDRVACDSVAVAVLKRFGAEQKLDCRYVNKSVWDQVQIYYAAELGIGQADPAMITIEDIHAPLFDEIKANWV